MGNPVAAPARLGRYELLARLATGGMGEIFLARMEGAAGFEKLFVVKRILPHLADDSRFRAMLIAEARIASMMTHANICHVYELGETDGQLYIVMEYLEGITVLPMLRKVSKERGALDLGFIGGVIEQATAGLHYAHELKDRGGERLGIVHRDVSPSNLFLTDSGVVKVLDFGIAKVKDASTQTQSGVVKGKYAYMAPEQLRGATVDRRADVFALGIVVYEMLALRRLFQRKTDYLTFHAVMEQPIIDIRHYRPDCPDALALALAYALSRDPAHRYETARQFGNAVLDAVSGLRRPWSQSEISDYISANFADAIRRRSSEVSTAVRGRSGQQVVSLLGEPDDVPTEVDETDHEFPPVDSAVTGSYPELPVRGAAAAGREVRTRPHPTGSQPIEASERVPTLEAPSGVPGATARGAPTVVVSSRRGVIWALSALAVTAIAAAVGIRVWSQQPDTTRVVIEGGPESEVRSIGSNRFEVGPLPDPAPAVSPVATPPDAQGPPEPVARRPQVDPFLETARRKQADVTRCASAHGAPPPGTRVIIRVAPDGHASRVAIDPESVDGTPLGMCLKNVFRATAFPRGEYDRELEVKIHSA
ncbi:MAG TPA: serine/threonine-protein kinase [Kofleriaceae bacterium]|nr:serine/threonine-protein kinase [Kofleriaceae bacterium]